MTRPALLLASIGLLALGARIARWREVFREHGVFPLELDGDSAWHLRRILLAADSFPHVAVFDPLVNWPNGGPCPWAPGFDLIGAIAVIVAGGKGDPLLAATAAALLPVLWGLIAVVTAVGAARAAGAGIGGVAAAGLVAALAPAAVGVSRVGRVDHHVAEAALFGALGWWALARPSARPWRWELGGAAILAAGAWVYSGAILYAGIAAGLVAIGGISRGGPWRPAGSGAPAFALAAVAVALLYAPVVAEHGQLWTWRFPSLLHAALLAAAAAGLAALGLAWGRWRLLAGLGLGASALFALGGGTVVAGVRAFLLTRDPWLAEIAEFQRLDAREGFRQLGILEPLAPIVVAGAAWRARGSPRTALVLAVWGAAAIGLGLLQQRFTAVAVAPLAVAAGVLAGRLGWLALPLALAHPGWVGQFRWTSPPPALEAPAEALLYVGHRAGTAGPGPGVLVPWDFGHLAVLLSGRPVIANGFGDFAGRDGFEDALAAFTGGEAAVRDVMERRGLAWWVAGTRTFVQRRTLRGRPEPFRRDAQGSWVPEPAFLASLPAAVAIQGGSGLPGVVPHLEGLAPVLASTARVPNTRDALPWLWVFEPVAGAVLAGAAPPDSIVTARIALGEWIFDAWTRAGAGGEWALRVPLPSGRTGLLPTSAAWEVSAGGEAVQVEVSEEAVASGTRVEVGGLGSGVPLR